ncbi:MAG TPA: hypothetical protein VHC97_01780 [Thermoanaerobaculia bacterium]|nr:hypothetical protein [Thermoanaerobaculia bacterium]
MPDSTDHDERIQRALQLLIDEVRDRIDRHPLGHLVAGRGERIDLRLALPTALRDGQIARAGHDASEAIQEAIQSLLQHSALFQPGRVLCLRCQTATCEHSAPTDSRQVFAGWSPAGIPRFADFGQWLLQRRDPRVDLLYRDPPQVVTVVVPEAELAGNLIPAFKQREDSYRIHAQVAAGWYRAPAPNGPLGYRQPIAISLQVISSRTSRSNRHRRRFGLNVIGIGPGGEPLENLYDRLGEIPWGDAVRWAQGVLVGIEGQLESSPRTPPEVVEKRIEGMVNAVARRLEKDWRGKERRTRHGQQRHEEKDRPTRMAMADLARATSENLLFDTRRETLVVVGDRGRAHVFNLAGKLVTSVRYNPAIIEKRRQNGLWRPAAAEEIRKVREQVNAVAAGTAGA